MSALPGCAKRLVGAMAFAVVGGTTVHAVDTPARAYSNPPLIVVDNGPVAPSPGAAAAADLSRVEIRALDPAPLAAVTPAPMSVQQTIVVPINGGSMSAAPATMTIVLHRLGRRDTFQARFGPLTVTDARGSLEGWRATLRLTAPVPGGGELTVRPDPAVAVTGRQDEVQSGRPAEWDDPAVLMSAPPGGGGGIFNVGGTVTLSGGEHEGDTVTISVAFASSS